MALLLTSNAYFEEISGKIRNKPVLWEGYQRAGIVSAEDVALLKKIDGQPRARIEMILISEGPAYARLYLSLLKKLSRLETIQYTLVMIGDALIDHEERIPLFLDSTKYDPELPYDPLLKLVENSDDFVRLKSLQLLTVFLGAEPQPIPDHLLHPFLSAIAKLLTHTTSTPVQKEAGVQLLQALLPRQELRLALWDQDTIISSLEEILHANGPFQLNYQTAFCFWLLTFEENIARSLNRKYDVIPALAKVAKSAAKEKVVRVIIATFRNLIEKAPSENLPPMLVAGILPFVKNLSTRKWSDDEIPEDLAYLKEELTKSSQSLTTFDEYVGELASGHLSWSPVHESESFWKENASKLSEKDHEHLKTLVSVLKSSEDPIVLAVAAHDLGQYVKYADRGKKAVDDLHGKTRVMELMSHSNPDVRYRALLTTQLLVSHAWAP